MRKRIVSSNQSFLGRKVMPLPISMLGMLRSCASSSPVESAAMISVRRLRFCAAGTCGLSCAAASDQQAVSRSRIGNFFIVSFC